MLLGELLVDAKRITGNIMLTAVVLQQKWMPIGTFVCGTNNDLSSSAPLKLTRQSQLE